MNAPFRHKIEYTVFYAVKTILNLFPRKTAFLLASLLGNILFVLDQKHRELAYSNLKTAFGDQLSPSRKKFITKACFQHFCHVFLDFLQISRLNSKQKDRLISVQGTDILKRVLRQKKGALIFTAHFGLWEIAAQILSKYAKLNVIARSLDNPLLEKELHRLRAEIGSHVIYKQNAARHVLKALNQNELVAVLIDQNVLRQEGIFVEFFGKDASTTPSLATFYLRTKAPIIPIFCTPTTQKGYHLKIMEPLDIPSTGDFNKDVTNITQICTRIIERQIKQHPHYWLWFHDRWRSRPLSENAE
ncbi:MAG: hypothetical protein GF421_01935 [Candidatus Aminicenantes bacterium]|nr:hypothetical protein [Candidatus Aminicenantes bacterium]